MKRIFSHVLSALSAGLCLRLLFVLEFPTNSGDTILYEQMATNWVKHGAYAMLVGGQITPVDLRMPGYPAFLALIYALMKRTGANAHLFVMLVQTAADLACCLVIAALAALLVFIADGELRPGIAFRSALWLAVLCPFTANYVAVPLTEVFTTLLTAAALALLCLQILRSRGTEFQARNVGLRLKLRPAAGEFLAGMVIGLATLFRPETLLLLLAAWLAFGVTLFRQREFLRWGRFALLSGLGCLLPLVPWAVRNAVTLHEVQFLAPKYSNLPGELVPSGFMAWEKTWLYRVRDCYLVSWKLNEEVINVEDIPSRAFDTPQEKERVAAILKTYNDDLTLTSQEDAEFSQLARERTARHPLRTYLWLPIGRAFAIWFTPRIELLPLSGTVFPLAEAWEDDPVDQSVTIAFFVVNLFYVGLALWGGSCLWRASSAARPALVLLGVFILLRTAFLTTLETPEPRYVLECFPIVLALGAQVFAGEPGN